MKREIDRERLRALRKELELTQDALADRCGIDRTVYNKIESGVNLGTSHELRVKIASGLDLELDQFEAYNAGDLSMMQAVAARKRNCAAPSVSWGETRGYRVQAGSSLRRIK